MNIPTSLTFFPRVSHMKYFRAIGLLVFLLLIYSFIPFMSHAKDDPAHPVGEMVIPVTMSAAQKQSMPVWIEAQGTVTPRNYVNVMPRVAGLLQSVRFQKNLIGGIRLKFKPRPFELQCGIFFGSPIGGNRSL